jgi:hypothetical protein
MSARSAHIPVADQYVPLYIVRCAWCATTIRETPHFVDVVSHGLCRSCAEKFSAAELAVSPVVRDDDGMRLPTTLRWIYSRRRA